jgi:hypothetical protein
MSDNTNRLSANVRSWFEPIVAKSSKLPLWVADGLASVGAVLLIVLLRAVLPNSLGWLATGIIITLLAAFVWMDWQKRRA